MIKLKPWIEAVALHPDVLSKSFSEGDFALDLGLLADFVIAKERGDPTEGLPSVPTVYRDAEKFFRSSYLTSGLRSLLEDVLDRLGGGPGNRVLKLMTAFGGGKSHTLAALFHAARSRNALDSVPEAVGLPRPGKVRVAVFDGQFFGGVKGKALPGTELYAKTVWGWIAWCLRGMDGYELLREQDQARVAPGGDELLSLLQGGPNLILLDEVLEYLISVGGIKVEQTTLRDETLSFLKRLTVAVGSSHNTAMVFSLQSSAREALEQMSLLHTVDHLAARKDQRREPVEGNEILSVIQRRLLATTPDLQAATETAAAYQRVVTQMRRAHARTASERHQAEDEGIGLRDRIRGSYPFHPALIDLIRDRWAAIPDFQRTRGALRFLAACLRATHREGKAYGILGPGEIPLHDSDVRLEFLKEIGQQADFQAVFESDFIGANAKVRGIDDRRAREVPAEGDKRPATRLATAILLYSFGGPRHAEGAEGDTLPPGITEAELMAACVGPDLDSTTVLACLKELKEQCLYLHYDGVRYCFRRDPNVTLLIEHEADAVSRDDTRVRTRCREMLEERLAGHRAAVIWPSKPGDIPDNEPSFLVAYMPFEFGANSGRDVEAMECFERAGTRPRVYRNGIGLAVPREEQVGALRRAVRYMLAAEQVRAKSKQLNLTHAQTEQLKEREFREKAAAEAAFLKLYSEVWLPKAVNGSLDIVKKGVGGRPLKATLDGKKRAMVHQRAMELIADVERVVFDRLEPRKIVDLFRLGQGDPPRSGIRVLDIVAGFYSFLGFTRLTNETVVRAAIAEGIRTRKFAYTSGVPVLGADGRYEVDRAPVRLGGPIGDGEVDLSAGFVIALSAVPLLGLVGGSQDLPSPLKDEGDAYSLRTPSERSLPPVQSGSAVRKTVELTVAADRSTLFDAWRPLANLADMAGKVTVTVRAESDVGFDWHRLEQAVFEPLRELGLLDDDR